MNPNQLQNERRSKELDAQEAYLESVKAALDQGPMTIKVYEARVKAHEEQLTQLAKDVLEAEKNLDQAKAKTAQEMLRFEDLKEDYNEKLTKLDNQVEELTKQAKELRALAKATSDEIDQRHDYQKEQEAQIEETITEGNATLLELNGQVAKLTAEIQLLTNDKLDLRSQVDGLILRTEDLKSAYDDTREEFATEKQQLEAQIATVREELVKETSRYQDIGTEVNKKLDILKEKEESLIAKQDALRLDRQALDHEKRRWGDRKASLYGDDL